MTPRTHAHWLAAALAAIVLLTAAPGHADFPWPWKRDPKPAPRLTLEGRATSEDGAPLAGVTILLEATRDRSFERLRRSPPPPPLRLTAETDDAGAFSLVWQRSGIDYRDFALTVAMPIIDDGSDRLERFYTRAIDDLMRTTAAQVQADVVVPADDASALRWLQRFLAGLGSDDEERIYRELGTPDRVDAETRRDGAKEEAWWYFARGVVYRLRDGALHQVTHFDPIPDP
ncbi:MAG: hypothetical protein AAF772_14685 [Acidobacteriota bacterium]